MAPEDLVSAVELWSPRPVVDQLGAWTVDSQLPVWQEHGRLTRAIQLGFWWSGAEEQGRAVNGQWRKRSRWKVSHFVRADVERAACGKIVTINEGLEHESTEIGICDRCDHCERRLAKVHPYTGAPN